MGILDAPARPTPLAQVVTVYGHSFTTITVNHPATTLSAAAAVGATTITVASNAVVQRYHRYELRDAASYQNPEDVYVVAVSGTTVTLAWPLTVAKASGALFIDPKYNCVRRLGKMLGDPQMFTNRGVGGGAIARGGSVTAQGGFNTVMQLHPRPPGVLGDPSPGMNLFVWGTNDLGTVGQNGTTITQILRSNRHCIRAVQARVNLARIFECETAFPETAILTTFAGGTWTNVTNVATQNSGTGYRHSAATGATATHALGSAAGEVTSRIVDFCFLSGASLPGSEITFTLDGAEVFPIGGNENGAYGPGNRFSTASQHAPITNATAIPCVARFPTDGNAHTIVATAGVGGMTLDWIGYEADYCAPSVWANICVTTGIYTDLGSQPYSVIHPNMLAWNEMLEVVLAEFGSTHIGIADMYEALSPGGVPIDRAWTTVLDHTHPNTFGNGLIAEEMYRAWRRLALSGAAVANL
jgi:hypothetical protein